MAESRSQLTLDFEPGRIEQYPSLKAFVRHRVQAKAAGKVEKIIAADMDMSPSDLSRKLADNPTDPRNFSVDDLEHYIAATGDVEPVYYLVEKYLESDESRQARAVVQLTQLLPQLTNLLKQVKG